MLNNYDKQRFELTIKVKTNSRETKNQHLLHLFRFYLFKQILQRESRTIDYNFAPKFTLMISTDAVSMTVFFL